MKISGIYKITNTVTEKCYIGSAVHIPHRWRIHRSDLKLQKHGSVTLQRSYNLHGVETFTFEILEYCEKKKLIEREQFYIDTLKPEYNILKIAGSRLGMKHTEEFKAKCSALYKGRKQPLDIVAKRVASNTGKKRSDISRKNMAKAQRKRFGKDLTSIQNIMVKSENGKWQ